MEIRPYQESDLGDLYDVCLRTGHHGDDARGIYTYPDLLGDIFAGPYVTLEPRLAFVLDDGKRVVGYVLGTTDTVRFAADYRREWLPVVRARYPEPVEAPGTPDERMIQVLHDPEGMVRAELADHPAHLHIDLLPSAQGGGHGRALIRTLLAALRAAGAGQVHLGVHPGNHGARAFYARLGFHRLEAAEPVYGVFLGRSTAW